MWPVIFFIDIINKALSLVKNSNLIRPENREPSHTNVRRMLKYNYS